MGFRSGLAALPAILRLPLAILALGVLVGGQCESKQLQGIYVAATTILEGQSPVVLMSTQAASAAVSITDALTGSELHRVTLPAGPRAASQFSWIGAGWSHGHALPSLPPGFYEVRVDPSVIEPSQRNLNVGRVTYLAPLVVRPVTPSAPVLLVFDVETSQAYNEWGGRSLYTAGAETTERVGLLRPGTNPTKVARMAEAARIVGGLGLAWEMADPHWIADHPGTLSQYRIVVMIDQMEYVGRDFVDALRDYVANAGRLIVIGNESLLYQTRREGPTVVCHKRPLRTGGDPVLADADPTNDAMATYEWARVGEPETRLLGVSTWLAHQPAEGVTQWSVTRSEHWLWEGTGLADGDPIRQLNSVDILDGTSIEFRADGLPYVTDLERTETPANTLVLGLVPTRNAVPWWCWHLPTVQCQRPGWATMVIRQDASGGIVAVIPDKNWFLGPRSTSNDPVVRRITENLLGRLAVAGPVDVYDGYAP